MYIGKQVSLFFTSFYFIFFEKNFLNNQTDFKRKSVISMPKKKKSKIHSEKWNITKAHQWKDYIPKDVQVEYWFFALQTKK